MDQSQFNRQIQSPSLITAKSAARLLGVSVSSFYRLVAAGLYPRPIKMGLRMSRWHTDEIIALAQNGLPPTTAQQQ